MSTTSNFDSISSSTIEVIPGTKRLNIGKWIIERLISSSSKKNKQKINKKTKKTKNQYKFKWLESVRIRIVNEHHGEMDEIKPKVIGKFSLNKN